MSDRKYKRPPEAKPATMTPDTLKETLGELAQNIDSLVDNLTMGMPDPQSESIEVVTEHVAEPETTTVSLARLAAAAPRPTFESAQQADADEDPTPVEPEAVGVSPGESSIEEDSELVDLAEGLIDSVETDPRDASGNRLPATAADDEPVVQSTQAEEIKEELEATESDPETDDDACDPDLHTVGVDLTGQDSIENLHVDELDIETPPEATAVELEKDAVPELDATTAGVIPWSAPEPATRSSGGGAIWKIAAMLVAAGLLAGGWFFWSGRGDDAVQQAARPAPVNRAVPFTASTGDSNSATGVSMASVASLAGTAAIAAASGELPPETPLAALADPGPEAPESDLPSYAQLAAATDPEPDVPEKIVPVDVALASDLPDTTVPLRTARAKTMATEVVAATRQPESEPEPVDVAEATAQVAPDPTPVPLAIPVPRETTTNETIEVATNLPAEPDPVVVTTPPRSEVPEEVPVPADVTPIQPLLATMSTEVDVEREPDLLAETVAAQGDSGPKERIFQPPKLIRRGKADYSERSRKRGERGVVELLLLVNSTGAVKRVIVEHGMPGSELEASAISAALRSKYEPATNGGEPVEAWATERFVFEP